MHHGTEHTVLKTIFQKVYVADVTLVTDPAHALPDTQTNQQQQQQQRRVGGSLAYVSSLICSATPKLGLTTRRSLKNSTCSMELKPLYFIMFYIGYRLFVNLKKKKNLNK